MKLEDADTFGTSTPPVAVHIGTSSLGNGGPAAWVACIIDPINGSQTISDIVPSATAPAIAIRAFVGVLRALPQGTTGVVYARDKEGVTSICERVAVWQGNGWRTAAKKPVANRDLWIAFVTLQPKFPDLTFEWVDTPGDVGSRVEEEAKRLSRSFQTATRTIIQEQGGEWGCVREPTSTPRRRRAPAAWRTG